ncbi:MAG: T9SS type A sorting domain-containing protein, partial [Bacteroidota bacterium]
MMSGFMYYNNINNDPRGNPSNCEDYYQYMNSTWLDGLHLTYGGTGRNPGTDCNFIFPGTTDPLFPGQPWSMFSAGSYPGDVRFLINTGTFTLNPHEERTIDFAYIYTRDTVGTGADAAINNVAQVSKVIQWFNNGLVSCPAVGINEYGNNSALSLSVSPNPSTTFILLNNISLTDNYIYTVTDITGRKCLTGTLSKPEIDISKLQPGEYQLQIRNDKEVRVAKFVKL